MNRSKTSSSKTKYWVKIPLITNRIILIFASVDLPYDQHFICTHFFCDPIRYCHYNSLLLINANSEEVYQISESKRILKYLIKITWTYIYLHSLVHKTMGSSLILPSPHLLYPSILSPPTTPASSLECNK